MKIGRTRVLTGAAIGLALLGLAACSSEARDDRFAIAMAAMNDSMSTLIPENMQDATCDSMTRLSDPDDPVASPLYSSNGEEAVALRNLLAAVGQHGGDAAGITFDDQLQKVVLGEAGVTDFCASR